MKFYVSLTASEATTAGGQPLVRGGEVDLSKDQQADRFNARLIAEGQLISVGSQNKTQQEAADLLRAPVAASPHPPNTNLEGAPK